MKELVFNVTPEEDGGYSAKAVGEDIYTQGDSWEELREMVLDATRIDFDEDFQRPDTIRLRMVRDEVVAMRDSLLAAA